MMGKRGTWYSTSDQCGQCRNWFKIRKRVGQWFRYGVCADCAAARWAVVREYPPLPPEVARFDGERGIWIH